MHRAAPFELDLGRRPLDAAERAALAPDLRRLGLDEAILDVLETTLALSPPHSTPLLLRARRPGGGLAGAALVVECRRSLSSLFRGRAGRIGDALGRPVVYWGRYGAGADGTANPGFVAEGVSRAELADAARRFLARRYFGVMTAEEGDAREASGATVTPFVDCGVLDVAGGGADLLFARHGNLRRKLQRFARRGGTVEIVRGAVDPATVEAALACLRSLEPRFMMPCQDIYPPLVTATLQRDDDRMLHLLARIDGELAGYQTFVDSGTALHLLHGAFDRRRRTTWHAYERLLVTSAELAADLGRSRVEYGPVVNATKAAMLTRFRRCHLRVDARLPPVRAMIGGMLRRSAVGPERVAPFAGVGAEA